MARAKKNPYKLTSNEKQRFARILQDSFEAVNTFDNSDETLSLLVERLNLIDEFVKAKNKGLDRNILELEFSRQAGMTPLTVQDFLHEAAQKICKKIEEPEDEHELMRFLEKNGAEIHYSQHAFIRKGKGELQPPAGKPPRVASNTAQPRFSWLMLGLLEAGYMPSDFSIHHGEILRSSQQKSSYRFVNIPEKNVQIAVSNRQGDITFISTKIYPLELYANSLKKNIKDLPGMNTRALKANVKKWIYDIRRIVGNPDGTPFPPIKKRLDENTILNAAHLHHKTTGEWPTEYSGYILHGELKGEKWSTLNAALYGGGRGLPGGSSISQLLIKHKHKTKKVKLTIPRILAAARHHYKETKEWPTHDSGPVKWGKMKGDTWRAIDMALTIGGRGLEKGGSSLHKLLVENKLKGHMTTENILKSAKMHFRKEKKWPGAGSGPVLYGPMKGYTWVAINNALSKGLHGLPKDLSVHKLLVKHDYKTEKKSLTIEDILTSARLHYQNTRPHQWPTQSSKEVKWGPLKGDTWKAIHLALYKGRRGLSGKSSLHQLLLKHDLKKDNSSEPTNEM